MFMEFSQVDWLVVVYETASKRASLLRQVMPVQFYWVWPLGLNQAIVTTILGEIVNYHKVNLTKSQLD